MKERRILKCSDCDAMLDGGRSQPHEYLMAVGSDAPGLYRCLLCDTWLRCRAPETAELSDDARLTHRQRPTVAERPGWNS